MKIVLVNANRMRPPIAPIALDYLGAAVRHAGHEAVLLDLCLAEDPEAALDACFSRNDPALLGISFRNVDDCFFSGSGYFVPDLVSLVAGIRARSDAPIVLGGCGYCIFPERLLELTGADFGVLGDGEAALVGLLGQLSGGRQGVDLGRVPGLVFRQGSTVMTNPPAWPDPMAFPRTRDLVDNPTYFKRGGQAGFETKRGCSRGCIYCVEPRIKGKQHRLRDPRDVAGEVERLLAQGIDVLHTCDPEFNLPRAHALAVCEALIQRKCHTRVRWYAYLSVTPFDATLARAMKKAGCVGINFTTDAASPAMLKAYGQPHDAHAIRNAVSLCRENGITVMLDLLFGGPGETPDTVAESIRFFKAVQPDCVGTSYGIRIYPGTGIERIMRAEGDAAQNPSIHRRYTGSLDLLKPTFYLSQALGGNPAALIRQCIAGDERFFPPADPAADGTDRTADESAGDHNYNDNTQLMAAIEAGARGAYWDILRGKTDRR